MQPYEEMRLLHTTNAINIQNKLHNIIDASNIQALFFQMCV